MEKIRKNLEMTDHPGGLIITHAMGGGTGSGLLSKLISDIKDYQPSLFIYILSDTQRESKR